MLPKVPFPGALPANPITFGGKTYTYDAGFFTQMVVDCVSGQTTYRWRLFDFQNQRLISDVEAELLGISPEVLVTVPNLWTYAAEDTYVADCVTKNLGCSLIATLWPQLASAQTTLATAQAQLTTDQAALTAAQIALAETPGDPTLTAQVATLTAAVNSDTAAVAASQTAVASLQTQITTLETQFA